MFDYLPASNRKLPNCETCNALLNNIVKYLAFILCLISLYTFPIGILPPYFDRDSSGLVGFVCWIGAGVLLGATKKYDPYFWRVLCLSVVCIVYTLIVTGWTLYQLGAPGSIGSFSFLRAVPVATIADVKTISGIGMLFLCLLKMLPSVYTVHGNGDYMDYLWFMYPFAIVVSVFVSGFLPAWDEYGVTVAISIHFFLFWGLIAVVAFIVHPFVVYVLSRKFFWLLLCVGSILSLLPLL